MIYIYIIRLLVFFFMLSNWLLSGAIGEQYGNMKLKVVKMFGYLKNKEKGFK